jgi:hypothetical protein
MTVKQRLLAVPALAGVLYLSVIIAGLSGFDSSIWALFTAIFLIWHILLHMQGPALALVVLVHGALAAALLGLGALIGQWVPFAPNPMAALAVGVVATVLARLVRLPPEKAAEIAALADEAMARLEETKPSPAPASGPEAQLEPVSEPEPESADMADDAAIGTLMAALDALPPTNPRQHDLVAAITPAIGPVAIPELVSALFARARATGMARDMRAVTVLLTDPSVARQRIGHGDAEAAFHMIAAFGDTAVLAHWAMQTEAVLDLVPGMSIDLPDALLLREAAETAPEAATCLLALAQRRDDGDGGTGNAT